MDIAITRQVSRSIAECELTFLDRTPINFARACEQHARYEAALRDHGAAVLSLPEEPDYPDAVFVEDIALVLDECAVITLPGAESRRRETESIARVLAHFRQLHHIEAPGHMDGGDILRLGRRVYVGTTERTDMNAIRQLGELLGRYGYGVEAVAVNGCLHLKSAATEVAPNVVLLNPTWVDGSAFRNVKLIEVDPSEASAANVLGLGDVVICSAAYPRTAERLRQNGLTPEPLEADELAKAEGGLTCCSLIFRI